MRTKREYAYIGEKRGDEERPWWQDCSTPVFKSKLADMTTPDLRVLGAEISGAIAIIQAQLESRGKNNLAWWRKASGAKGFIVERKRIVKAILVKRNAAQSIEKEAQAAVKREEKKKVLAAIRSNVEAGDLDAALHGLLDFLEPKTKKG